MPEYSPNTTQALVRWKSMALTLGERSSSFFLISRRSDILNLNLITHGSKS